MLYGDITLELYDITSNVQMYNTFRGQMVKTLYYTTIRDSIFNRVLY